MSMLISSILVAQYYLTMYDTNFDLFLLLQQSRQSLTEINTFHLSTITTLTNRSAIIINTSTACLMNHI